MATPQRPLSPHLGIYRFGWTMTFSFAHRATGVGLSIGTILVGAWLMALAAGPESFEIAQAIATHWFGRLILFLWSFAFIYHLCNGVRHLMWDLGRWLDLTTARRSAFVMLAVVIILQALVWTAGYGLLGGGS